ncbi:DUF4890 domain-containing protein [Rufibacter roseus]|uniref:DUF4890 domain-containing protein n=1 Tax=Rufibacter roseus TaxID=1567108 RepID=A0ABW2DLU3_9BACT|nr:DUF4890 domain-containing protein [Rufibacter roseus]
MKKLVAMIALGAMVTGTTFAQTTPQKDRKPRTERAGQGKGDRQAKSPEERAAKRAEMMTKKYNLSASQQTKIKALHEKQGREMAALRGKRGQGQEISQQQREAMKARHEQYNNELKSILTPEQYAQYQADRQNKGNGEHRGKKKGYSKRGGERKQEQKS